MNQWQNIQNSFRNWRREQVLWAVVVVLGLLALIIWFVSAKNNPQAPVPTDTAAAVGLGTPTPSATPSPSDLPTLEELPFELTQSDIDINAPTDEAFGPTDENPAVTESPTFYVRPFSSNTPTVPTRAGGGGGGFFPTSTPNNLWTQYARTSTAMMKTQSAKLTRTATFMRPTIQTATAASIQTKTAMKLYTDIAKIPRPEQILFFDGSHLQLISASGTPTALALTSEPEPPTVDFGDWAPNGRKIVVVHKSALGEDDIYMHDMELDGTLLNNYYMLPNQPNGNNRHPVWSPNGAWVAFVNEDASGKTYLYQMHWKGGNPEKGDAPRRITSGDQTVEMPDWSPDSKKLVYVSGGQLYTVDVNPLPLTTPLALTGGHAVAALKPLHVQPLPVKQPASWFNLSWLFQTADTDTPTPTTTPSPTVTNTTTETATLPSTATATVTLTATQTIQPATTTKITPVQIMAGTATVTRTPTITPTPGSTQISEKLAAQWPHFSPDGKSVLFRCGDDICLFQLTSYMPQKITDSGKTDPKVTYSYPFWSRNSSLFGYVAYNETANTYTIILRSYGVETPLFTSTSEIRNPAWRP